MPGLPPRLGHADRVTLVDHGRERRDGLALVVDVDRPGDLADRPRPQPGDLLDRGGYVDVGNDPVVDPRLRVTRPAQHQRHRARDQRPARRDRATHCAMVASNDGFELANEDLRIRGEGTVFDARQSGLSDLKLARLIDDFDWVQRARKVNPAQQ